MKFRIFEEFIKLIDFNKKFIAKHFGNLKLVKKKHRFNVF